MIGVFQDILNNEELAKNGSFQLSLIGRGDVTVPEELLPKVRKLRGLPYKVGCIPLGFRI